MENHVAKWLANLQESQKKSDAEREAVMKTPINTKESKEPLPEAPRYVIT